MALGQPMGLADGVAMRPQYLPDISPEVAPRSRGDCGGRRGGGGGLGGSEATKVLRSLWTRCSARFSRDTSHDNVTTMSSIASTSVGKASDVPTSVIKAWQRAKGRAKRGDVPCLTRDQLDVLWLRCDGRCAVSGVAFSDEIIPNCLVKRPFSPSIDQIEATKGYTLQNTRITCVAANFAMNQWGLDILRRVARGVVALEEDEVNGERAWYSRQEEKLRQAEHVRLSMTGEALAAQQHRIAGLKRAITMGPVKLSAAAAKASDSLIKARGAAASAEG
jgi:hypothetical protein